MSEIIKANEFSAQEQAQLFDIEGLCSCGDRDFTNEVIYEALKHMLRRSKEPDYFEPTEGHLVSENWRQFAMKVCDWLNLCEHGSSIRGAWLTKRGELLLRFYEVHGTDEDKWPEWKHSMELGSPQHNAYDEMKK